MAAVWHRSGGKDSLREIQTEWTVGDVMLASDQMALDRQIEDDQAAKAKAERGKR